MSSERQTHVSFSNINNYDSIPYDEDDNIRNGRRSGSFSRSPDMNSDYDPTSSLNNHFNNTTSYSTTTTGNYTSTFDRSGMNDINDQSSLPDTEKVVETSPDERYIRLNTLLGKGAYKAVYKAIDREEGYEVAWNSVQVMRTPSNKELDHEIQILKSVRHPNIIALHDAWYEENEFVFVTELMTSGTLREYIRKLQPLPNLKIVKRWSRQILKGLMYLHDHHPPIIHRDIKCDNIFINGAHGEVKIGDMGTAEMKMGKKYTLIGTPEFMAPEMYEEQGYSEKVDIYAFGMCLLEMATGEYPYSECRNAAQIYKKVSAGIKPACLSKVTHPEVLSVIENCIGPEEERMSAQEILEHSLLAVEPDVVLLATDLNHVHLTLQVVFKGMDKLSVKFDFTVGADTAEQVVREMIEEQVLPERYQQHITKEINRILRDMDKVDESQNINLISDLNNTSNSNIWRRENDIRSELEKTKLELKQVTDRTLEMEAKCEEIEAKARLAEAKYLEVMRNLRERERQQQQQYSSTSASSSFEEGGGGHPLLSSSSLVHPIPIVGSNSSTTTSSPPSTIPPSQSFDTALESHSLDEKTKELHQDISSAPSNALVSHIVDGKELNNEKRAEKSIII
ncbi:kinase-like domain-containing protein [Cunninghamella echinulata]|nr:kinase-like domain-containing protein [Cunninghamella echinulata]